MKNSQRPTRVLAVLAALALSLTACAGGGAPTSPDPGGTTGGSSSGSPTGAVTLDGAELSIRNISCLQPPVNDGRWRVFLSLEDGDLTMDEDGSVSGKVDGVNWLQSSGDDNTSVEVSEAGATGKTTVHPSGHDTLTVDDTAVLEANITC